MRKLHKHHKLARPSFSGTDPAVVISVGLRRALRSAFLLVLPAIPVLATTLVAFNLAASFSAASRRWSSILRRLY